MKLRSLLAAVAALTIIAPAGISSAQTPDATAQAEVEAPEVSSTTLLEEAIAISEVMSEDLLAAIESAGDDKVKAHADGNAVIDRHEPLLQAKYKQLRDAITAEGAIPPEPQDAELNKAIAELMNASISMLEAMPGMLRMSLDAELAAAQEASATQ